MPNRSAVVIDESRARAMLEYHERDYDKAAQEQIEWFLGTPLGKWRSHSSFGTFIPAIVNYCEEHKIAYSVLSLSGEGYAIVRLSEAGSTDWSHPGQWW